MLINEIEDITSIRNRDYAHPLVNFLRISLLWNVIKPSENPVFNPILVADMMVLMKEARIVNTPKWDNYRDIMGYTNTVDMMIQLYYEVMQFGTKEGFEGLNDNAKQTLVQALRDMSFSEQYNLLILLGKHNASTN